MDFLRSDSLKVYYDENSYKSVLLRKWSQGPLVMEWAKQHGREGSLTNMQRDPLEQLWRVCSAFHPPHTHQSLLKALPTALSGGMAKK